MADTLTAAQLAAVAALAAGESTASAAKAAKTSRRTVTRWLENETFLAALSVAAGGAMYAVSARIAGLAEKATEVLEDTMDNAAQPAQRLRAAEVILANMIRVRNETDTERRLREIEAHLGIGAPATGGGAP